MLRVGLLTILHKIIGLVNLSCSVVMADRNTYNVILLGEVGVGKTSLFNRIKTGRFHEHQSTLGEERIEKRMIIEGDQLRVSYKMCLHVTN